MPPDYIIASPSHPKIQKTDRATGSAVTQEHLEAFSEAAFVRGVEIELEICVDHIWLGRIERTSFIRGSGRKIMKELIEIADDHDLPIRCAVDAKNSTLLDWYHDLGFEIDLLPGQAGGRQGHVILDRQPDDVFSILEKLRV